MRVGSLVVAEFFIDIDAISVAPTGNLRIDGLPYTEVGGTGSFCFGAMAWDNINLSAGCIELAPRVATSTAQIYFVENYDNLSAGQLAASAISATSLLTGLVTYRAVA